MFQVGGHVECKKTITMSNGGTSFNLSQSHLELSKNPPNFMTLLNQDVPEIVPQ
jgi:hypothetical protein